MSSKAEEKLRGTVCPLLAAMIWGSAFVAQGVGAERIEPFTFNAIRSWIGAFALFLLSLILKKKQSNAANEKKTYRRQLILGGLCCGTALALASNLQQAGLGETDPGKAGFITSLYVVLVPIFGLFCNRRAPITVWISTGIALAGLYFLCITHSFTISPSDAVIILCAVVFAIQILLIDRFSPKVNGMHLCCAQLTVSAIISTILMLLFESPDFTDIIACWFPLVYVGVFSSGIAYTLQIAAQKNTNPTTVTVLLSMESVFAVLTGLLVQGDLLSLRELCGCALMFGAVILASVPKTNVGFLKQVLHKTQ